MLNNQSKKLFPSCPHLPTHPLGLFCFVCLGFFGGLFCFVFCQFDLVFCFVWFLFLRSPLEWSGLNLGQLLCLRYSSDFSSFSTLILHISSLSVFFGSLLCLIWFGVVIFSCLLLRCILQLTFLLLFCIILHFWVFFLLI